MTKEATKHPAPPFLLPSQRSREMKMNKDAQIIKEALNRMNESHVMQREALDRLEGEMKELSEFVRHFSTACDTHSPVDFMNEISRMNEKAKVILARMK